MSSSFIAFPGTGMGARRVFPRRGVLLTAVLGAYYAPWNVAHADFAVMTESSNISLTSPPLVEVGTGQKVTAEELGGARVQARVTGQIDAVVPDEPAAFAMLRRAFSYLPSRAGEAAPIIRNDDSPTRPCPELHEIVPERLSRAYDVKRVIQAIVDRDSFFEYSPEFAPNLVTGLARVDGKTVVVVANQPKAMAGVIDVGAVIKATKALRLCDELGLPLLSLVDTPGVLPTKEQEFQRLMTTLYEHGMRRLKPKVPKVAVVLRKGVGFGVMVMTAGDPEAVTFVWPNTQICFTGVDACVRVVHRQEIERAEDPQALVAELAERYSGTAAPWIAARLGYIDDVIDPTETRAKVVRAFEVTRWRA
jgi:acetyl-CoA carboxylase carboxyltransferase component